MATQHKNRLRQAPVPGGVHQGARAAGRYYNLEPSLISKWVAQRVVDLAGPSKPGVPLLIDDASLRRRLATYTPDKDNQSRKGRSRTIPAMQAERATTGHSPAADAGGGVASPAARPAAPGRRSEELVLLNTREWLDRFYGYQSRVSPKTKVHYDATLGRFAQRFANLPMVGKDIMDYIGGLANLNNGRALSDGTKGSHLKCIQTFYRWLGREHGYQIPDLTHSNLDDTRENAVPIWTDEIRQVLAQTRDHTEYTLILLLAQTGCRIGELCTIRPELLHDHWVEVWGKPTKNNKTGYRPLPIPDEAFKHLQREFATYGELVMSNQITGNRRLAQAPEPVDLRRGIDWRDPKTYKVQPGPWAIDAVKGQIERLLKRTGVYRVGKGAHAFRRAYEQPFLEAGGDLLTCRRILGHFNKSDMDQLYFHAQTEKLVEAARKYAPRAFLNEVEVS